MPARLVPYQTQSHCVLGPAVVAEEEIYEITTNMP